MAKTVPCLLTIDSGGCIHLYDVRQSHPHSLIMSIEIKKPAAKSGYAMVSLYNHLRKGWLQHYKAKAKSNSLVIDDPKRYLEKWKKAIHD